MSQSNGDFSDPDFAADAADTVIDSLVESINRGDIAAAGQLIEAEHGYIQRQARAIARADFARLRQPSWLSSAAQSVFRDLLSALVEYAQGRVIRQPDSAERPPAERSDESRRMPLVTSLANRAEFRDIVLSAIRRHLERLEYHRRQAIEKIRPQEIHLLADRSPIASLETEAFEALISPLEEHDQQLLRWAYRDGLTQTEMATRLNCTQSKVSKDLKEARERLKQLLAGEEP